VHRKRTLAIRIRIPKKQHGSHYISPATKGMTMAFTGPTAMKQVVNLTPSDPRCTGSPLTCTIVVALLAGSYSVTIDTYDQAPNGGGIPAGANLLSTAKNAPLMVASGKSNHFGVTLDGAPAALTVINLPIGATAGTAFGSPQSFGVIAQDADHNTIVGAYDTPVTVANSDTSGATTIKTFGNNGSPANELLSSSDVATLSYTGLAIAPATVTARAQGATNGTGTFAPTLQPIVLTTSDTLNPSWPGVDLYAPSGTGSTAAFTASEVGWSNAPYNKTFSASTKSGCVTVGSVAPSSATSFTATVAASPSAGTCGATIVDGAGQSLAITLAYTLFPYDAGPSGSGVAQSITVPIGIAKATIIALGAQGACVIDGGLGASVTATIPITNSGETLAVYVGASGGDSGFNGGGDEGTTGAGGGASDVREGGSTRANRVVVAGGGGGCSPDAYPNVNQGGNGGAPGANGADGATSSDGGGGGGGGTQTMGGAGGTGNLPLGNPGNPGTLGVGGAGAGFGGNGGGGYYGGGGSGQGSSAFSGGGGGGSSFAETAATDVSGTAGGNPNQDGQVTIIW
jgi:hypothetical protein